MFKSVSRQSIKITNIWMFINQVILAFTRHFGCISAYVFFSLFSASSLPLATANITAGLVSCFATFLAWWRCLSTSSISASLEPTSTASLTPVCARVWLMLLTLFKSTATGKPPELSLDSPLDVSELLLLDGSSPVFLLSLSFA